MFAKQSKTVSVFTFFTKTIGCSFQWQRSCSHFQKKKSKVLEDLKIWIMNNYGDRSWRTKQIWLAKKIKEEEIRKAKEYTLYIIANNYQTLCQKFKNTSNLYPPIFNIFLPIFLQCLIKCVSGCIVYLRFDTCCMHCIYCIGA